MGRDDIGSLLKQLRINNKYTLDEVGKIIGVSKQTLYKYENNIISNIPSDKIELLAKLYNVSPAFIMGWDEPTTQQGAFIDESDTMKIGEIIKHRRKELGMSVDELAAKLGKNRATVYRYENGDIKSLPLTVLEPLAKALHTSPGELIQKSKGEYYTNPQVNFRSEYARVNEGILLDASKDLTDEELESVINIVNQLRNKGR